MIIDSLTGTEQDMTTKFSNLAEDVGLGCNWKRMLC